ncbi:MAG: glutathione synthase [Gammaproteobacteria bacterium]|nr:glutathione synthase [Gammaproteobacteria bacterium]
MILGIVMDPIESIKPWKDTSFAMLLEAQKRHWEIRYMLQSDLYLENGKAYSTYKTLTVHDNNEHWFDLGDSQQCPLAEMNIILMRKDPPFDMNYIATTYLLELAEKDGCLVANKAASLRDCNEKVFTSAFPQCCCATTVTSQKHKMHEFLNSHKDIIIKPLNGMGGEAIFRIQHGDGNANVIMETVSQHFSQLVMLQTYLPEISAGDKRILLINGKVIPYSLARIPQQGENRGNIAAGGAGVGQPLSRRDQWICEQLGPELKNRGLYFVGIDVIGDYLTEINVTSPTCVRELDSQYNLNISALLMDELENEILLRNEA